jgi:hypothetical protein
MRQLLNNIWGTISRIGGWGMNNKIIKIETLLHLNLEVFIYFYLFILYLYFYIFIFFYPLSVSPMPFQITVD